MKRNYFAKQFVAMVIVVALALTGVLAAIRPAAAATGQICDQYGTTTQGNYVIMNNRWGTTATQCINVTNNGFQIVRQDGVGNLSGAPVSYPAIYIGCHYSNCSPNTNLPMKISSIGSANTNVTLTYPGSGTYDAAYDIWLNADTNVSGVQDTEIMIWLHHTGSIQPIGSKKGTIYLAGRTWDVWVGNNGQNNVVSYSTTGMTNFNADVKPFLLDAITRGTGFGTTSWYLTSMQMGFEPWIGGVGLSVNSFSASINSGGGGNPTPVRTPTPGSGGGSTCSPVTATISAPFSKDGAGTFCFKSNNLGSYINSWNVTNLKVNGVGFNNVWAATSSLPAKIGGYWYISYSGGVGWSHFEAK